MLKINNPINWLRKQLAIRSRVSTMFGLVDSPRRFEIFCPSSKGGHNLLSKLTELSVNQTFPLLSTLVSSVSPIENKTYSIDEFCNELDVKGGGTEELKKNFDKYGSDKASKNNYHLIYDPLLSERGAVKAVLEIGLGTNNTKIASNMGKDGKPGASLRAFRDFLPHAMIYGADIDREILFEEDRIKTFFVDQTNPITLEDLSKNLPDQFDLIIDDGLHAPNANIATLTFALPKLKSNGGWFILEDIHPIALSIWEVVGTILPRNKYRSYLVETKSSWVFACQKISDTVEQEPVK